METQSSSTPAAPFFCKTDLGRELGIGVKILNCVYNVETSVLALSLCRTTTNRKEDEDAALDETGSRNEGGLEVRLFLLFGFSRIWQIYSTEMIV